MTYWVDVTAPPHSPFTSPPHSPFTSPPHLTFHFPEQNVPLTTELFNCVLERCDGSGDATLLSTVMADMKVGAALSALSISVPSPIYSHTRDLQHRPSPIYTHTLTYNTVPSPIYTHILTYKPVLSPSLALSALTWVYSNACSHLNSHRTYAFHLHKYIYLLKTPGHL